MQERPERKEHRLKGYDYSQNGYYFITICINHRECILSTISENINDNGNNDLNQLSEYGIIVNKYILMADNVYQNLDIDKYVIMPNHIHLIISITNDSFNNQEKDLTTTIPQFITAFKRMINKECGFNLWQRNYHDHVIRNEEEHMKITQYIQNNPIKWQLDCFNQ